MSEAERAAKREDDVYMAKLRRNEQSKWVQRAKVRHIGEGEIIQDISILLSTVIKHRKNKKFS